MTADISIPHPDSEFWQIDSQRILHPAREEASYKLTMSAFFNASHSVSFSSGRGNLHRHSFHLKVTAMAFSLAADNSLVPYETLREILARITAAYEGAVLNDLPPFRHMQPTTEILTGVIAQQVERLTRDLPVRIIEIAVMESPTQGVSVQLNQQ